MQEKPYHLYSFLIHSHFEKREILLDNRNDHDQLQNFGHVQSTFCLM